MVSPPTDRALTAGSCWCLECSRAASRRRYYANHDARLEFERQRRKDPKRRDLAEEALTARAEGDRVDSIIYGDGDRNRGVSMVACDHSGIGRPGCPFCDRRPKSEGGGR